MEKERPFNFKLLVPPRISTGQVFAVRPQEIAPDTSGIMQPVQTFSKCPQTDLKIPFQNTSMAASSKSFKTDAVKKIAVMPMEKEEKILASSELCSKLLEEFEKINSWKLELDSEITRKDKLLHENKRTIDNQRKAIQELQFENENLSMKLENQMCENSELKNKISATQNLSTILNDAFERTVEKMSLFESERLETHELFIQNSETIQRMISAFEGLRVQTESDKLKFKEELKQYEDIEQRVQEELRMKEEEVAMLWAKMNDKDNRLQEVLQKLQDKEEDCIQLQETARQHYEMLQMSKQEYERLLEKLKRIEESKKDNEEKRQILETALQKKEMEYLKIVAEKDSTLEELYKTKDEQTEKLLQIQTTAQELQESLSFEMQRTKELEEELKIKTSEIGETVQHKVTKENEIKILREDMDIMSKSLIILEEKLQAEVTKVSLLDIDLKNKNTEISQLLNKGHITSVEKEFAENALNNLQAELRDLKEIAEKGKTKLCEMGEMLRVAQSNERKLAEENNQLNLSIEQYKEEYKELMANVNKLQLHNERITEQAECASQEKESKAEEKTEKEIERLTEENKQLRDELEPLKLRVEEQDKKMVAMRENYEECDKSLQKEVMKNKELFKSFEIKLNSSKVKVENKTKAYDECLRANKSLKKQLATETEKCNKLDTEVNDIKEQLKNIKSLNKDKLKKLQAEIELNAATESELYKKVEKLNLEAQEVARIKEETEIKCQHKISDMVALMEKHKSQYDKMIEEKDAELDNRKLKEAEANASYTSLVLELSETKIENSNLKQQLEHEVREMDKLKQEITDLNLKLKSVQEGIKEKTSRHNIKEICCATSQETQSSLKFLRKSAFMSKKKAGNGSDITDLFLGSSKNLMKTPPIKEPGKENLKTQSYSSLKKAKTTPQIKSYRIRTPPSTGKSVPWMKTVLEFDSVSDSSEQQDLLSPTMPKSPGVALKLAAVKRMRDAGWTAVTRADMKKKKKASEKIFA